jgi:hypothetical protein
MQESSYLLGPELSQRINSINQTQSHTQSQWSNDTMLSFQRIFFLLQNTPLTKRMLTLDPQLPTEDSDKLSNIRKATEHCMALLKAKTDPIKAMETNP